MRPYTVNLEEEDIESLRRLATQNDLPPGIYARVLLLRALRKELQKREERDQLGLTSDGED